MNSGKEVLELFAGSLLEGTDEWKDVIHDDISFVGPIDQCKGKEAFIKLNERFFPLVQNVQPLRRSEENGLVTTEAKYTISAPSGNSLDLQVVELAQTVKGKITSMDIYYDPTEFKKAFSMN